MKLNYQFEITDVAGDLIAVPVGDGAEKLHGVLTLNETAADLLRLLASDTDEDALVSAMREKYEGDEKEIRAFIHGYLDELRGMGLLA